MSEKAKPKQGSSERSHEGKQPKADTGADLPPAGPHAKPALTNDLATPGAGALPKSDGEEAVDAGTG